MWASALRLDDVTAIGQVFEGKYRIERVIGRGGMGIVVAAVHLELDERVAIKVLLPELGDNDALVERFLREAKAAVKIRGDHVARVFDVGRAEGGLPYIVLEYLEGRDLGQVLLGDGPLPVTSAVDHVIHACEALAQAHALGIVHRDIKPANLFLIDAGRSTACVKVLDFGISKLMSPGAENVSITRTSEIFGSPQYMSPEQVRASRHVDGRTDVWALGVVLYELLAGVPAFRAESVMAFGAAILGDTPAPVRTHRSDVPRELEAVILRCLQKPVEHRFASVVALAEALRPFASTGARAIIDGLDRVGPAVRRRRQRRRLPRLGAPPRR